MLNFIEKLLSLIFLTGFIFINSQLNIFHKLFIQSQKISTGILNIDNLEQIENSYKNTMPSEFILNHKKLYEHPLPSDLDENESLTNNFLIQIKEEHLNTRINTDDKRIILNDPSANSFFSKINLSNDINEKLKIGQDYYLKYDSDSKMLTEFDYVRLNSQNIFDEQYYRIKCENTFNKINFEHNDYTFNRKLKIKKTDVFSLTNFILDQDGSLYLSITQSKNKNPHLKKIEDEFEDEFEKAEIDSLDYHDDDDEFLKIKNFWISLIEEKESEKSFGNLILLLNDGITLVIFKIKTNGKKYFNFDLKYDTKLSFNSKLHNGGYSLQNYNITKAEIVKNGNFLIVATYENGLNIFKRNLTDITDTEKEFEYYNSITTFFNSQRNIVRILLIDFIVSENIIYMLIDKFGIKQYSLLTNKLSSYELYHPFIKNLVRYNKDNNTYQSIIHDKSDSKISAFGATVDNNHKLKNINEFYIEFMIAKSSNNIANESDANNTYRESDISKIFTIPVINKIYVSEKNIDSNNFYNDGTFTYLLDNDSRKMYLILNTYNQYFPATMFIFDLFKIFDDTSERMNYQISKLINQDVPGLIFIKSNRTSSTSPINKFIFISNFFTTGSSLKCNFKNFGKFVLNLTSIENSISPSEYGNCLVLNKKSIFINVFDDNIYIWAIIGIIIGCLIILIIFLFVLTRKKITKNFSHIVNIESRKNSNNENERESHHIYDNVEMVRKNSEKQNVIEEKEIVLGFDEKFNVNNVKV